MTTHKPVLKDRQSQAAVAMSIVQTVLADLKQVSREVRILLVGQFLMNASNFTAFPLMAVYMAEHLGFSAAQIGTVLTLHLASGRVLPIVTGPLSDRYGFRSFMVAGLALRAVGFFGFGFSTGPIAITIATLTIGLGTAFYESAVYGVFGRQPQQIVARVFVLNNLSLNLGVIIGPMFGAALLVFNPVYPFQASAVLFAVLALWSIRLGYLDCLYVSRSSLTGSWRSVTTNTVFLFFLAATFAWWFLFSQLFILFPLLASKLAGSDLGASAVFTTNGIAGLLFVGLSLIAFKWVSERCMLLACYVALIAIYGMAGWRDGLGWLLFIVAAYTLVETLILPAIESITAELAEDGKQATSFGALGLAWGAGGSLGNYAGSWLAMENVEPFFIWGTLAGVAGLGFLLTLTFVSMSRKSYRPPENSAEDSEF
ncbi:MFS transporter [Phyllobacterium myrsinacearum]|uniref:MFS family permease n=1 Tax=Phyllobacterium myrsinacearum TaxID=28101 RepID=A0A839EK89_9HYPH|nr:MFS transporter [Phyllobacterium myrsinacearum]MBA8879282.1 MFS family permease [Phyllobacterium myrsinacearum]